MAQINGMGTTWNLPNYSGELFSADAINTPLLSTIGGLTGGKMTTNFVFPTSSEYDFAAASQPDISETASLTAPSGTEAVRTQVENVVGIHQQAVELSYHKQGNVGRMTGINTIGQANNAPSELDFQISYNLQKIARDVEYSFINGVYAKTTVSGTANQTRGIIECADDAGNTIAAIAADLSTDLVNQLLLKMADHGAYFSNVQIHVNAFQKQAITALYKIEPRDRTDGGANISMLYTDFGIFEIVWNRFVPADTIVFVDVAYCAPVFMEVPGKGVLFYEELAKTGASERGQIYGEIGLDHGPEFMHGSITGLAIA